MATSFILERFDNGMHYILLDKKTSSALSKYKSKRVICELNNELSFHCAIMPKKEGGYYINIGAAICKKLKIGKGSRVTATFSEDHSTYQFEFPEEFQEVLQSDPDAEKIFHSLTMGNQRGLIYLVTQVKSVDKRIERSLKIADRIKHGITSPKKVLK
jgi:hypothetical protein